MDFREYFAPNPTVYQHATQDQNLKYENLEVFMKKWQDPHEADKLMKIEKELFEVKEIIHKNLNDLLKRGKEGFRGFRGGPGLDDGQVEGSQPSVS